MNSYPWKKLPQVHPERIAAIVDLTALQAVEGYVWCDKHGDVHSDSLNPYGYSDDPSNDFCTDDDHRALYMEADDNVNPRWDDREPIEPMPVRSAPVPLTVRRHTEESMAIWRANLLNALPADMLQEDRERIADALLTVAVTQSTELRRKRLIDKLMSAAEEAEDIGVKRFPQVDAERSDRWAALMMDAAEEIRSTL